METDENLIRFMDAVASGEAVPAGLADRLIADYPWFVLPAAMRLQRGSDRLDADARQMLAARVALGMADRTAMLRLADDRGRMFDGFYPPAPGDETPTTETAIDTFLNAYGTIDPAEEALLERLIFNPVADYSQVLIKEQEESRLDDGEEPEADEQDRLMDALSINTATRKQPMKLIRVSLKTGRRHRATPLRGRLRPPTQCSARASRKSISKGAATKRLMKLSIH